MQCYVIVLHTTFEKHSYSIMYRPILFPTTFKKNTAQYLQYYNITIHYIYIPSKKWIIIKYFILMTTVLFNKHVITWDGPKPYTQAVHADICVSTHDAYQMFSVYFPSFTDSALNRSPWRTIIYLCMMTQLALLPLVDNNMQRTKCSQATLFCFLKARPHTLCASNLKPSISDHNTQGPVPTWWATYDA